MFVFLYFIIFSFVCQYIFIILTKYLHHQRGIPISANNIIFYPFQTDLYFTRKSRDQTLLFHIKSSFLFTPSGQQSFFILYLISTLLPNSYFTRVSKATVSTCVSLSKLISIYSSMIGSLNLMDLSH